MVFRFFLLSVDVISNLSVSFWLMMLSMLRFLVFVKSVRWVECCMLLIVVSLKVMSRYELIEKVLLGWGWVNLSWFVSVCILVCLVVLLCIRVLVFVIMNVMIGGCCLFEMVCS